MKKNKLILLSVILFLALVAIITVAIIYISNNLYRSYNEELYVNNETYNIIIYPPIKREHTSVGEEYEYSALCEIRLNTLYDEISDNEYYTKQNEIICGIIDDVNSYIVSNNINEKFRIYIKTETWKDYYTFEFYNYSDDICRIVKDKFNAETKNIGLNNDFVSCKYTADMYENSNSQKYAIEVLSKLKIKYLMAGRRSGGSLNLTGLDCSDFEKIKPFTLLITSNFTVSEDIYNTMKKSEMIIDFNNNSYNVDCSGRDDLDWYFDGHMFYE